MKVFFRPMLNMKTIFRSKWIRTVFFLSIAIAVIFPVLDKVIIYPMFTEMVVSNTMEEAKHLATHLSSLAGFGDLEMKAGSIPPEVSENISLMEKDSHFEKIKIYSSSGEVIHSSDPTEVGTVNTGRAFHEIVAQDAEYARLVHRDDLTSEGERVGSDLIEIYIPIDRGGKFVGAFEIYYDVTHTIEELDKLLGRSLAILLIVTFGLLGAIVSVAYRGATAEEALQKAHDELESQVAQRTRDLQSAVERLKSEVTERKKSERALRDSEERFRSISSSAKDAIVLADDQGSISYWNEAAENIFGYSDAEVIGYALHDLIVPERFRESHLSGMSKFREGGRGAVTVRTMELTARRKDGEEFPIELSLSSTKVKGRWHAVAIIREITKRKELERQLRQAEKLASLEVLSSGAAHEINNPLNVITLNLQLLLKDQALGPERRKSCEEMIEQVESVRGILSDLDTFAQQMKLEKQEVDIQAEIGQVLRDLEAEANGRGVSLDLDFTPTNSLVMGNPILLQHAFTSILDNALRSMLQGGTLAVRTRVLYLDGTQWFTVRIADTGEGIPQKYLSRVFDPFFSMREVGEGRGLGLSVARGVIEDHQGTISVASEEGSGTSFEIFLPTVAQDVDIVPMETW